MSDEASERNCLIMVLSAGALSNPPITRLTRPLHRISKESILRMANPPSILIEDDLALIRG